MISHIGNFTSYSSKKVLTNGLFQKKKLTGGLRTYFFEHPPRVFRFFNLPIEIPDKIKFHSWKLDKIVLHPSQILRPKTKTPGKSTRCFLDHPWKFHVVFN